MSKYENLSLLLTAVYDILTFLLLLITAYVALIQRKLPNIALYTQVIYEDTENWSWRRRNWDFVLENRGILLKNIKITSEPDYLGWGIIAEDNKYLSQNTSEYFANLLPLLNENEKKAFFWCDVDANKDVFLKPFKITVEFDNPTLFFPKRLKKHFNFDFSAWGKILHGINTKFDIHNGVQEMVRTRKQMSSIEKSILEMNQTISEIGEKLIEVERDKSLNESNDKNKLKKRFRLKS